jgi:hypothetical protein
MRARLQRSKGQTGRTCEDLFRSSARKFERLDGRNESECSSNKLSGLSLLISWKSFPVSSLNGLTLAARQMLSLDEAMIRLFHESPPTMASPLIMYEASLDSDGAHNN